MDESGTLPSSQYWLSSAGLFLPYSLRPKVETSIGTFVPVEVVFPGRPYSWARLRELLAKLPLREAVEWCIKANYLICTTSDPSERPADRHRRVQTYLRHLYLNDNQADRINHWIKEHSRGGNESVVVFFRAQALELLRLLLLMSKPSRTPVENQKDEYRSEFVEALLLAGHVWSRIHIEPLIQEDMEPEQGQKPFLLASRKGVEAKRSAPFFARPIGRGSLLLGEYMQKCMPRFDEIFKYRTGFTLKEFYKCSALVAVHALTGDADKHSIGPNSLGEGEGADLFRRYLERFSQDHESLKRKLWGDISEVEGDTDVPPHNYVAYIDRPFLRLGDERFIPLDAVFFSQFVQTGPLFEVVKAGVVNSNEVFGAFGKAFEDYAFSILESMFPSAPAQRFYSNLPVSAATGEGLEVDGFIDDVIHGVVIEMKAVSLQEDKLDAQDPEAFYDHLMVRYGVSSGHPVKGVGQLARVVSAIFHQKHADPDRFGRLRVVYPVLLVHDPLLPAPGFGLILAKAFRKELVSDGFVDGPVMLKDGFRVHDLIIMTIADLEDLESSLENFALRDLLDSYSNACPNRNTPFHNYMFSSRFASSFRFSTKLLQAANNLLAETGREFFPGAGIKT